MPIYITASILGAAVFAALAVPYVAWRTRTIRAGARATARLLVLALMGWLAVVTVLALNGSFEAATLDVVPVLGVAVAAALAGLALAAVGLPGFRAVLTDPEAQPRLLTLHVWRIEGAVFLVLLAMGQLPALFAVPAGVGDLAIGLTAPLMARNLHRRGLAIAWNVFGLADLALALTLGSTTSPGPLHVFMTDPTSVAITTFPLAIIPTFLVPLSVGLHIVSLRYLLHRPVRLASLRYQAA